MRDHNTPIPRGEICLAQRLLNGWAHRSRDDYPIPHWRKTIRLFRYSNRFALLKVVDAGNEQP